MKGVDHLSLASLPAKVLCAFCWRMCGCTNACLLSLSLRDVLLQPNEWAPVLFFCACACLCYEIYPLITEGESQPLGACLKGWLSSQWCQRRLAWTGKPPQCRPLNQTATAACLCWTSAPRRLTLSRPLTKANTLRGERTEEPVACWVKRSGEIAGWIMTNCHALRMWSWGLGSLFHFLYPAQFMYLNIMLFFVFIQKKTVMREIRAWLTRWISEAESESRLSDQSWKTSPIQYW